MARPARPRNPPSVWATYLSKVLAGESQCRWATWFRAHHYYDRPSSNFNKQNWILDHTRLVDECALRLERAGYEISLEGQNAFQLRGGSGTILAGCPDIVARSDEEIVVVDCKTGAKRTSHEYQVLIYMLALPHARPRYKGVPMSGLVYYRDDSITLSGDRLDDRLRQDVRHFMALFGGDSQPRRVPSFGECRFCDIPVASCSERVTGDAPEPTPADDLF
jgi:hypothetical protein